MVDKSSSDSNIHSSSGVLELLNKMDPIIHLDFEKIVTLKERKFPGMVHDDFGEKLIGDTIQCAESNIELKHSDL